MPQLHALLTGLSPSSNQPSKKPTTPTVPAPHSCYETVVLQTEIDNLKKEIAALEQKLLYLKDRLTYAAIKNNMTLLRHYTGLPSSVEFDSVVKLLRRFDITYAQGWKVTTLCLEDQLLLTLLKLRQNFGHEDLGYRFKVSNRTVANIVNTFVHALHEILVEGMMVANGIPSVLKNKNSMPSSFSSFSSCRIILDCTEVQCEIPTPMDQQSATWSNYKQRNTFKALVGVAPNAAITFVSAFYPGCMSDKEIVRQSMVMDQMQSGDLILADKGFLIQELLPPGVSLNLPPFLNGAQFTIAQAELTIRIARARIHVERAIQRVKEFKILHLIPVHYRSMASKLLQVCAALVNMQSPLIKEVAK